MKATSTANSKTNKQKIIVIHPLNSSYLSLGRGGSRPSSLSVASSSYGLILRCFQAKCNQSRVFWVCLIMKLLSCFLSVWKSSDLLWVLESRSFKRNPSPVWIKQLFSSWYFSFSVFFPEHNWADGWRKVHVCLDIMEIWSRTRTQNLKILKSNNPNAINELEETVL